MTLRGDFLELDSVGSTQEVAAELIRAGRGETGVVFAHDQTSGRGRFGREWLSKRGDSLTMSLIFWDYADWPKPWLIGMSAAIAAARAIGCNLRWPNDLSFGELKTGGILTELITDSGGVRIPVVGMGINLRQESFPPKLPNATSVFKRTGEQLDAFQVAQEVLANLKEIRDPREWQDIESLWLPLDKTAGKVYKTADGRRLVATGVGEEGELVTTTDERIFAADAQFGSLAGNC